MVQAPEQFLDRLANLEGKYIGKWSLDDWVVQIQSVYGVNNRYRFGTYLWLQVTNEAGQLAESVRRGRVVEALDENLVNLFGWLCSFVGKYLYESEDTLKQDPISILLRTNGTADILPGLPSYAKWILYKYPRVCCTCGYEFCVCSAYRDTFERRKEDGPRVEHRNLVASGHDRVLKERTRYKKEKEYNDFVEMPLDSLIEHFISMYSGGHHDMDLWKIVAHFQEEVGEVAHEIVFLSEIAAFEARMHDLSGAIDYASIVSSAFAKEGSPRQFEEGAERLGKGGSAEALAYLRNRSVDTLREELADVFSWICAILGKIGDVLRDVRKEPERRYLFWESLAKRYRPMGSVKVVCFACGRSPCEPSCRVVFFTRKVIRDEVKSSVRTDEIHEERIKAIVSEARPKILGRIEEETLQRLVRDGQIHEAIEEAKRLYAGGRAISDYPLVMLSSVRESDWDTAREVLQRDGRLTPPVCRILAWSYWRLGRLEKAIEVAEGGLRRAEESAEQVELLKLKNSLAYYYADARSEQKADLAFQYSNEAVVGRPGDPKPLDTQGFVHIVFGKSADEIHKGVRLCQEALDLPESDFDLFAKHMQAAAQRLKQLRPTSAAGTAEAGLP